MSINAPLSSAAEDAVSRARTRRASLRGILPLDTAAQCAVLALTLLAIGLITSARITGTRRMQYLEAQPPGSMSSSSISLVSRDGPSVLQ